MTDEQNDASSEPQSAEQAPPPVDTQPVEPAPSPGETRSADAASEWAQIQKSLDTESRPFDPNVGLQGPKNPPPPETEE